MRFNDANMLLAWSFPLWRLRGAAWRVNWLVLVGLLMLVYSIGMQQGQWALVPVVLAQACVSLFIYGFAKDAVSRWFDAPPESVVLWCCGAHTDPIPSPRPLAWFATGIAGSVACAACAGILALLGQFVPWVYAQSALGWGWQIAFFLGTLNLLACRPFDGALMWRGLLWRPLGRRRSVQAAGILGLLSAALLIVLAFLSMNVGNVFFAALITFLAFYDWREIRGGSDPLCGWPLPDADRDGWVAQAKQARADAADARRERDEQAERADLDRLLAKVSEQGLHTLSDGERRRLNEISRKQRERES